MYSYQELDNLSGDCYLLFFDLETSQSYFLGQILTASFLLCNQLLQEIKPMQSFKGQLSPLELPHPDAIATNQINVLEHYEQGLPESELAAQISAYIQDTINEYGAYKIYLIAHNLKNFDLVFLRTVLIRNGYNPYFKLNYVDSLHLFQKIGYQCPQSIPKEESTGTISFRLQKIADHYKLNTAQTHSSEDDVSLLKECLQTALSKYELNLQELLEHNPLPNEHLFQMIEIDYHDPQQPFKDKNYIVLQEKSNTYLLINIDAWMNADSLLDDALQKKTIRYFNLKQQLPIAIKLQLQNDKQVLTAIKHAKQSLQKYNFNNYFTPTTCDIEQDIYRLNINKISYLKTMPDRKILDADQDLKDLVIRKWLRNFKLKQLNHRKDLAEKYEHFINVYANYRYDEGVKLSKFDDTTNNQNNNDLQPSKSDNFLTMQARLDELLANSYPNNTALLALQQYYRNSNLVKKILSKNT